MLEQSLAQLSRSCPLLLWVLLSCFFSALLWLALEATLLNSLRKRNKTQVESQSPRPTLRYFKLLWACAVIIATVRPAKAQFPVELQCPTGYTVSQDGRSWDPATFSWRYYICENPVNGFMNWNDQVTNGGGSSAFPAITGGTNTNSAQMIEGTSSSLSFSGLGQVVNNQTWWPQGIGGPTVAFSITGGNLASNFYGVQVVYNSAAGHTLAGAFTIVQPTGCTGSNQCSLTVTAPTLPSGYTSYTVYDCATTGSTVPCTALQQAASNACVAITTNCVITTLGAGAGVPTTNTAILQPPDLQSGCGNAVSQQPQGWSPFWYEADTDGNYYPLAGIDASTAPLVGAPYGTLTFCQPVIFNDTVSNLGEQLGVGGETTNFSNGLIGIAHELGDITPIASNRDDWATIEAVHMDKSGSSSFTVDQYLGDYEEVWLDNNNFLCAPAGGENCISGKRTLFVDSRSCCASSPGGGLGFAAITGAYIDKRTGTAGQLGNGYALLGEMSGASPASGVVLTAVGGNLTGGASGGLYAAFQAVGSPSAGAAWGLYVPAGFGNTATSTIPITIYNTNASVFLGKIQTLGLFPYTGAFSIPAGITGASSFSTTVIAQPGAPGIGNGGTAGTTSYTYEICALDGNGGAVCSNVQTTTTGNATLSGTNYNTINGTGACKPGIVSFNVYRTASAGSPSSTGLIGNGACTLAVQGGNGIFTFNDTGLAGSGSPPTGNNTGSIASGDSFNSAAVQTVVSCATSGNATFSQPMQGTSYKKVVIYLAACLGAATYTYPTAFSFTPQTLSQSLAAIVSSVSATSVTVTGTTSTGFIDLDGY
jgi:hypothetical protein